MIPVCNGIMSLLQYRVYQNAVNREALQAFLLTEIGKEVASGTSVVYFSRHAGRGYERRVYVFDCCGNVSFPPFRSGAEPLKYLGKFGKSEAWRVAGRGRGLYAIRTLH